MALKFQMTPWNFNSCKKKVDQGSSCDLGKLKIKCIHQLEGTTGSISFTKLLTQNILYRNSSGIHHQKLPSTMAILWLFSPLCN